MDVQELRPKPINNIAVGPLSRKMDKGKEKETHSKKAERTFSKQTYLCDKILIFFLVSCSTVVGSDVSGL